MSRGRRILRGFLIACGIALVLGGLWGLMAWRTVARFERIWEEEKRPKIAAAADAAQPILDALVAYKRDHGRYPEELAALTPQYLAVIPEPRKPLYPPWKFFPLHDGGEYMLFAEAPQNYYGVPIQPPTAAEQLVYESDGTYQYDPWSVEMGDPRQREPIELIDGWAYFASHLDMF